MADLKTALTSGRGAWNSIRAQVNPAIKEIADVPALKPVYDVFVTFINDAIAGAPIITAAINAAGGLDTVPPMTPEETVRAQLLSDQVSALWQAFEAETGLELIALTVERLADGKVSVGHGSLLR